MFKHIRSISRCRTEFGSALLIFTGIIFLTGCLDPSQVSIRSNPESTQHADNSRKAATSGLTLMPGERVPLLPGGTPPGCRDVTQHGVSTAHADNAAALQQQLNNGGCLYLPAGTYRSSPLTITQDRTRIVGAGSRTVLKLVSDTGSASLVSAKSRKNIWIETLTLDGSATVDTFDSGGNSEAILMFTSSAPGDDSRNNRNINVKGLQVRNAAVNGVSIQHTEGFSVTYSTFRQIPSRSVDIVFSRSGTVSNNDVDGGVHGIQYWGTWHVNGQAIALSSDLTFHSNRVTNVAAGGIWGAGASRVKILRNRVSGCGDVCLDLEFTTDSEITDNTVSDADNGAIATFYGSARVAILRNRIRQTRAPFTRPDGIPVLYSGIHIHASGEGYPAVTRGLTIAGNEIITQASTGIYTDQGSLADTVIEDNSITTGGGAAAIDLLVSSGLEIRSNHIQVDGQTGINLRGVSHSVVANNWIRSHSRHGASGNDFGGVHLYQIPGVASDTYLSRGNTLRENVIFGFQRPINENCWVSADTSSLIENNRLLEIYRRNLPGYTGTIRSNHLAPLFSTQRLILY